MPWMLRIRPRASSLWSGVASKAIKLPDMPIVAETGLAQNTIRVAVNVLREEGLVVTASGTRNVRHACANNA